MEGLEDANLVIPKAVCEVVANITPDIVGRVLEDLNEAYREFRLLCRDDAALGNLLRMTRTFPQVDFRELCLFIGVSYDGEPLDAVDEYRHELLRKLDAVISYLEVVCLGNSRC